MVYSEFAFDCSKKVLNVTETNFDICPIGTRESWAFQVISPWVKFLKAESVKRDKSPVSIPDIHFCIANLSLNISKLRDLRKRYFPNIPQLKNYACVYKRNKKTPKGVYAGFVRVSKNYVEWHWKVEQCINNECLQERQRCTVKYTGMVPLLLKTKLTSILPPYMLRVWVVH